MASTLSDPGFNAEAGGNYVTSSAYKLPEVKINTNDGFALSNFDTRFTLNGQNTIALSNEAPNPLDQHQGDVPTASPFKVRPSDIKGLEKTIITELDKQVDEFEGFKNLIKDTEGWIFIVQTPGALISHMQSNGGGGYYSQYTGESNRPDYTDPDPSSTQKIVDSQNALVRAVGDAYQLVGEMAAVLNNAANNYVYADKVVFGDGTNIDDINPPT